MRLRSAALFQSTRPSRGATDTGARQLETLCISIHAPLAGRDRDKYQPDFFLYISIHAPLAGRDFRAKGLELLAHDFNPRAPRGARLCQRLYEIRNFLYFNPRAPRGARPVISLP